MTKHPTPETDSSSTLADSSSRQETIAVRAYHKYLAGGQQAGQDVANWLQAEQEIIAEQELQNPGRPDDGEPIRVQSAGELADCVSLQ
jgi:hypothetical protein